MENSLTSEKAQAVFVHNFNRMFKEWGKSQGDLSREIGVTQPRISYWVHGKATPTFVNLYNLAQVFGREITEFYKEIPTEEANGNELI